MRNATCPRDPSESVFGKTNPMACVPGRIKRLCGIIRATSFDAGLNPTLSSAAPLFILACRALKCPCHFVAHKVPQIQGSVPGLGAVLQIRCTASILIKRNLSVEDGKKIMAALQTAIVSQEADTYTLFRRICPDCGVLRPVKDYTTRRIRTLCNDLLAGEVHLHHRRLVLDTASPVTSTSAFFTVPEKANGGL